MFLSILVFIASSAAALQLTGRVVDPHGEGIPDAALAVRAAASEEVVEVRTDAAGRFSLTVPAPGSYRLRVAAPGFRPVAFVRQLTADSGELELPLELAAVSGEIVVTSAMPEIATELRLPGQKLAEEGSEDVGELFRSVAGLSAVRRGSINLEPTVRGLQEEQVGLFVDGTRTFAAGPARMDSNLSHVSPHDVEGIRVVKGPYALTWGSGTLAAIELLTVDPRPGAGEGAWAGSLSGSYGENAERADGAVGVTYHGEHAGLYLGGSHRTGGDYEDGDGAVVPADYESSEVRLGLGASFGEDLAFRYTGGYQEQLDLDYPGRLLDATYFYTRSHSAQLTWTGGPRVSEVFGQLYVNRKDHRMNNDEKPTARNAPGRIPPFALAVDLPTESNTSGGRFRVRLSRGEIDWTLGTDYYEVEQTARRFVSRRADDRLLFEDIVWPDATIEDLGGYGQLVYRGERLQLGAGVRIDEVDASAGELSPFYRQNVGGDTDQSETNTSAAVSATLPVGDWTLDAGIGRSVRTATVLERYSDRFPSTKFQLAAEFLGNPELDPEESLEIDLGLRRASSSIAFQAEVFYRTIDDYITVVADPSVPRRLPLSPPTVYRYVNGDEATFYGGELRLDHRVNEAVSWRTSWSYVWAEDEALGEPVLGIAPLTGQVGVRFHALERRLWLDLNGTIVDRQDRVAASRFEQPTPGYTVLDLGAWFEVSRRWTLSGGIENLGDRAYTYHLNSPNPFNRQRIREMGRNVRVGFEVRF